MKGPSLSTAMALLLLVLSTTTDTAVLKTHTSGTVPSTTKTSGMVPSMTKASGTIPSTTKASGTVPSMTKASGTVPSMTKASGTVPSTTKASGTTPSMTKASGTVPSMTEASLTVPSTTEASGTAPSMTKASGTRPSMTEASLTVPSTTEASETCPETCNCTFQSDLLEITDCRYDPSNQLNSIFDKYPNATSLVITSSRLTYLPQSVCRLRYLTKMNLRDNQVDAIPWDCLRGLKELILSYNRFRALVDPMDGFQSLETLSVDHNLLTTILPNVFSRIHDLQHLKAINLQSNRLTSIDSWPLLAKNASILLDRNSISKFTDHAQLGGRCNAESSYHISMTRNNISHLTDMFNGWGITTKVQQTCVLRKSRTINLDHNRFICDCVDYDLYKIMHTLQDCFRDRIFCSKPEHFYKMKIVDLPLDRISCSIKEDCPHGCRCKQIPSQQAMVVNCSESNMTDMPNALPELPDNYSYNLDYSRNKFESVDNKSYFHLVKKAVFSHNAIDYFSKFALLTLSNVTELSIDHNQLLYLPEKILGVVNMTDSLHMKLAANEWICDCYAKETRKWLLKMGTRIVDKDSIICDQPKDVKGRNMLLMTDAELKCGYMPKTDYMFYFGIGVATVAVWMVVIGIPTGILYANRLTLFRKYGWHMFNNDECYGEFKEFDIFLAYGEVNVDYAMEKLFVELENKGYKVAYHRINFIGGKPIKVNIEECIRKSKRTITVISKRFFDSEWCRCELMTALDIDKKQNTKRQIGILLEEIDDVPELDPKVKKFIKTDHCLRLGEDLFEEKMEYMLARKKLKDQIHRRPNLEQLRTRQHRPRQPPVNAARNAGEDPLRPPPAAPAANQPAVLNADTAHLLDNVQ